MAGRSSKKTEAAQQEQAEAAQKQRDEAAGVADQPADGEGSDASIAANGQQGVVAADEVKPADGDERTATQVNQQEGNRAEQAPKEQSDEAKFAVQNPDVNAAGIGSKQVDVDMPDAAESWLAMGTVPDVMDPMIEGDARDLRSKTVLQEAVLPEGPDEDSLRTAPVEATQGFSAERLAERDAERLKRENAAAKKAAAKKDDAEK